MMGASTRRFVSCRRQKTQSCGRPRSDCTTIEHTPTASRLPGKRSSAGLVLGTWRVVEAFVSPPKFEPTAPQVETQLVPGHFNTEPPVFERVAPDLEPSIFPVFYVAAFHSLILPLSSPPL